MTEKDLKKNLSDFLELTLLPEFDSIQLPSNGDVLGHLLYKTQDLLRYFKWSLITLFRKNKMILWRFYKASEKLEQKQCKCQKFMWEIKNWT